MAVTKLRENHKIYQKVDISLLFKSQNILQKRFLATVSILEKQLKAGNSKNCNSEVYFQFFSTLAGVSVFHFCQNPAKKKWRINKNEIKNICYFSLPTGSLYHLKIFKQFLIYFLFNFQDYRVIALYNQKRAKKIR